VILMIDNYDSFTWNLVQYLGELGDTPVVKRNDEITVDEVLKLKPLAIVISPGPGRPTDAGISCDLIRRCSGTIPILGVCLGHQCIGEVFGGKVVRADVGIEDVRRHPHRPRPLRHRQSVQATGITR
jgi:anthranilate synthase/aminodeoxychorismate synthase-like glutamine amidotransferase